MCRVWNGTLGACCLPFLVICHFLARTVQEAAESLHDVRRSAKHGHMHDDVHTHIACK